MSDEATDAFFKTLKKIYEDGGRTETEEERTNELHKGSLACLMSETSKGLNNVNGQGNRGWTAVSSIVDSGAIDSVAPMNSIPNVPTKESRGSMEGQTYYSADGTALPNKGEKSFQAWTDCGQAVGQTFQMADITRPLLSVGKLADQDNVVIFGKKGGYILNLHDKSSIYFPRTQGVYTLRTWVPVGGTSSDDQQVPPFVRHG